MFQLILNDESVEVSRGTISKQVFSEIYLVLDDVFFPDEYWTDFVLIIFDWWADELMKLLENLPASFYFMDGSFYFKCDRSSSDSDIVIIELYENNHLIKIGYVQVGILINNFTSAFNKLLRILNNIGEDDSLEFISLRDKLIKLQKIKLKF